MGIAKIQIFAKEIGTGRVFEVKDLYWFEENGVHDFGGEGHSVRYRLQVVVDERKVFDNLVEAVSGELDTIEPECAHVFFKCQGPAGDSCQPMYHEVCKACRWDKTKSCVMPDYIWYPWAVPQMEGKNGNP